jgi:hypothetical protein
MEDLPVLHRISAKLSDDSQQVTLTAVLEIPVSLLTAAPLQELHQQQVDEAEAGLMEADDTNNLTPFECSLLPPVDFYETHLPASPATPWKRTSLHPVKVREGITDLHPSFIAAIAKRISAWFNSYLLPYSSSWPWNDDPASREPPVCRARAQEAVTTCGSTDPAFMRIHTECTFLVNRE